MPTWKGRQTEQKIYVLPLQDAQLLDFPAIPAREVVRFLDTVSGLDQKTPSRSALFEVLENLKEEYVARLQPGTQPFVLSVPRRIPIPLHDVLKAELAKL